MPPKIYCLNCTNKPINIKIYWGVQKCRKVLCHKGLIEFILEPEIISNHRDKLAICGLSSIVLDGVSKIGVKRIHVAAVPRDLDCVSDCSLNAACGGLVFLRDGRVKNLRDAVDDVAVIYREHYRSSEILVALFE